ncbi:MAG: LLM class flavin-dependent oxidoreductase [SAR202 cluster bacterium]|nr:LLM class flavin-dependent oxidoreductase [SAR202 cluster bacterium]
MRLGYFAMPLHPPGADFTKLIHDDLEQMEVLDRLGYEEAWIGEHFTMQWEPIPSPELFIANALARTRNIKLGTGVTCMVYHNPFHLAHRIAQLDHMAKGRFQWGIGTGASPLDFEVFGIDGEKGEQRTVTRDTLDAVLGIWSGKLPKGMHDNGKWRFKNPEPIEDMNFRIHLKPYQTPHPPIAVAGFSAKSDTLAMAGERGFMPMSINHVPFHTLKTHWDAYAEGAKRGGHKASRSEWRVARDVYIAKTTKQARKEALNGTLARDWFGYVYPVLRKYNYLKIVKLDPDMPDEDVTVEYMVDNIWLVGSPDDVAAKIRKLYGHVGGFGSVLAMHHEWEPRDAWVQSMTLLAKQVIPSLSDLT